VFALQLRSLRIGIEVSSGLLNDRIIVWEGYLWVKK